MGQTYSKSLGSFISNLFNLHPAHLSTRFNLICPSLQSSCFHGWPTSPDLDGRTIVPELSWPDLINCKHQCQNEILCLGMSGLLQPFSLNRLYCLLVGTSAKCKAVGPKCKLKKTGMVNCASRLLVFVFKMIKIKSGVTTALILI